MECPEENDLLDFVRGDLVGASREAIESHVDTCPVCPVVLAELARLQEPDDELAVTDGDIEQQPPPASFASGNESVKIGPRLREGDKVGRYVVLGRVGAGGMGVVYAAYDPELDRKVAIKILLTSLGGSLPKELDDQRKRLMREAQAMAKLSHPNVITVHDVGEFRSQVFVAMEFIDGTTLGGWREAEPRSWREIAEVFLAAGDGLAAAHRAGLVHRDFKPDNVLIGNDGRVLVTDFGLARPAAGRTDNFATVDVMESTPVLSAQLTATGALVGTPAYMAPEQLAGERSGALADQFSFSVALYEALYGERPFEGKVLSHLMASVSAGRIRPVPKEATVPRWVRRALLRGLSTRPEDRFGDMSAMLTALRKDPRAIWRRWGTILLPTAVLGIGVVAYQQDRGNTPEYCDDVPAKLNGGWDATVSARLRAAFDATGRDYAAKVFTSTAEKLDAHAAAWVELQQQVCIEGADGSQPQALLLLRLSCLDRSLEELRTLTTELATADDTILDRAIEAANALPDPAACNDVDRLADQLAGVETQAQRDTRQALSLQIARAKILRNTGRYDRAQALSEETLLAAQEADDRWVEAEALSTLADLEDISGRVAEAERLYHLAMSAALASNHSLIVVRVAVGLIWGVSALQHDPTEAERWYEHGRAALERLGPSPDAAAQLENALAAVYLDFSRFKEAELHMRNALDIRVQAMGPDDLGLNSTWSNLGRLHALQGRYDEAEEAFTKAHDLTVAEFGSTHPVVGHTYTNLGTLAAQRNNYDDALAAFEKALQIGQSAHGRNDLHNATTLMNLGNLHRRYGQHDLAHDRYQRALEIQEDRLPPEAISTSRTRMWLVRLAFLRGDHDEALALAKASISALAKNNDAPPTLLAQVRMSNARVLLQVGAFEDAKREAQTGLDVVPETHGAAPELRLMLLDARVRAGERVPGALESAAKEIADIRANQPHEDQIAEADLRYAKLLHLLGENDRAREAAQAAIESYANAAVMLGNRAGLALAWRDETFGN